MIALGQLLSAFEASFFDKHSREDESSSSTRSMLEEFARSCAVERILASTLFDPDWYSAVYKLPNANTDTCMVALNHYLRVGVAGGYDPTVWFSEQFYRDTYADVRETIRSGLWHCGYHHYLLRGIFERRSPNANFDENGYLESNPDVYDAVLTHRVPNGYFHYACIGLLEGRRVQVQARAPRPTFPPDTTSGPAPSTSMSARHHGGTKVVEFPMHQQLKPNGEPFGYYSLGRDPQFILQHGFTAGFCYIVARVHFSETGSKNANMQFYIGDRRGFAESNSWVFPITKNDFEIKELIFNPENVNCIRFDPIDTRASFRIEELYLRPIPFDEGCEDVLNKMLALPPNRRQALLEDTSQGSAMALWRDFTHAVSGALPQTANSYESWIKERVVDLRAIKYLSGRMEGFEEKPTISILMPTYRPDLKHLESAIRSVKLQIYQHWELCIVDDGSCSPELQEFLLDHARDHRVKIEILRENCGIAAATNVALALGSGAFVGLLDHDDELEPHALFAVVQAINSNPDADMLYTDEDKISEDGTRYGPFFKPDWSPEFMLSCMYTCHFGVYRRSLVRQLGGFRSEFDFAQDFDLALRVCAKARKVVHVPDVLYHWRATTASTASGADAKPTAEIAARRALQAALDTAGISGKIVPGPLPGTHRARLEIQDNPLVSIVIPTAALRIGKNEEWYVDNLLCSIQEKTTYQNIEIILVHNGDIEPKLAQRLKKFKVVFVQYREAIFNISKKMNLGVKNARGKYILLLNDDMTIVSSDWIQEMLMWFAVPGVEGVGAKLLFPNDTVQHAGVLILAQGPSHVYYGAQQEEPGLVGSAVLARNYSAVTGACMMVRKSRYLEVGGFDPAFRVNYNDVDFCLKIRQLGRIVYTPYALLYHYESVSKDEAPETELEKFNKKWSQVVGNDPAYNRHLSQTSSVCAIGYPVRSLYMDY